MTNPIENNDSPVYSDSLETPSEEEIRAEEAIQDPGQFEGLPKTNKVEVFSDKVQERIDELTKNWRGTERDLKGAIEKLTDRDEEIEVLMEQNQKLMKIINNKNTNSGRPLDPEQGLSIEIKNVRSKMSEARKKLEWDVYDQLEEKLNDLNDQLITVKVKKVTSGNRKEDNSDSVNENTVAEFTANNSWFDPKNEDYDPLMRGAALEYDDFLLTKKEWKDKPLSIRLKEVKRVIEKKFKGTNTSGPPIVEPSRRSESGKDDGQANAFGLSDTEKRIADKMIPLKTSEERYKEYARQKKLN